LVDKSVNTQITASKRLKIENITEFAEKLTTGNRVYVPTPVEGIINFKDFSAGKAVTWDFSNSLKPAKEVIFPQTEEMFKYKMLNGGADISVESPEYNDESSVVIGIRPCDAHAMTKTDHNFEGLFDDPYYQKKRENTVLIGMACDEPDFNCFCTSMGGGPYSRIGLDALLVEIRDFFALEILTEKGMKLVEQMEGTLEEVPTDAEETISKQEEQANGKIQRHVDIESVEFESLNVFEDKLWASIAERCIGCGICVFVCPTCRCFDIQDEATSTKGRRIRVWDTCQFPEYTVHGSGYNPRPARTHRVRNRLLCRLKYTNEKFGVGYCTGCGRCTSYCPVNIDIVECYEQFKDRVESIAKNPDEACAEPGTDKSKSAEVGH
jgi:ferredoxin